MVRRSSPSCRCARASCRCGPRWRRPGVEDDRGLRGVPARRRRPPRPGGIRRRSAAAAGRRCRGCVSGRRRRAGVGRGTPPSRVVPAVAPCRPVRRRPPRTSHRRGHRRHPHRTARVRMAPMVDRRGATAGTARGATTTRIAPMVASSGKPFCSTWRQTGSLPTALPTRGPFTVCPPACRPPTPPDTSHWDIMQIQDLPYPDPGMPDARSGPRFLWWLFRNQLSGQLKSLAWGLLHFGGRLRTAVLRRTRRAGRRRPLRYPARPRGRPARGCAASRTRSATTMLHRSAITNWITAAARVQQLLARKTALLGSALTRRVAAGEVVAVSTGDVEKIGWFVESVSRFTAAAVTLVLVCVGLVVYQPALGVVVAVGVPLLALAVLPLLPRATRRADVQREKAGRATELASDTVAGLRVLRGIGGEELFLDRYRRASQEVRQRGRAQRPDVVADLGDPGPAARTAADRGRLVRRPPGPGGPDRCRRTGHRLQRGRCSSPIPLRHFEEIAMAYSFSRPSRPARRARAVAGARPRTPGARAPPRPRPATCTTRPPVCWRPPADSPPWCAATRTRRDCWRSGWAGIPAERGCVGPAGRRAAGRPAARLRPYRRPRPGQGSGAAVRLTA